MRRRVQDAVVHHRSGRERAELAQLEHAHRPQLAGVGGVDASRATSTARRDSPCCTSASSSSRASAASSSACVGLRRRRLRELAVERADLDLRPNRCRRSRRRRPRRRSRARDPSAIAGVNFSLPAAMPLCARMKATMSAYSCPSSDATLPQRHVVVHVAVELLQRLAVPLHDERRPFERRRAAALRLRAVTHRALLRVLIAALADLRSAEKRRAIGECSLSRTRQGTDCESSQVHAETRCGHRDLPNFQMSNQ